VDHPFVDRPFDGAFEIGAGFGPARSGAFLGEFGVDRAVGGGVAGPLDRGLMRTALAHQHLALTGAAPQWSQPLLQVPRLVDDRLGGHRGTPRRLVGEVGCFRPGRGHYTPASAAAESASAASASRLRRRFSATSASQASLALVVSTSNSK